MSFHNDVAKVNQTLIFQAMKSLDAPISAPGLAGIVGLSVGCVRLHLQDMHKQGVLKRGRYKLQRGGSWGYVFSISPDADFSYWDGDEAEAAVDDMKDAIEGDRLMRLANSNKGEGYTGLACAILIIAIRDWRSTCTDGKRYLDSTNNISRLNSLPAFHSLQSEVQEFWEGDDGQLYRDVLGCGMLDITDIAVLPEEQSRPAAWG